MTIKKVIDNGFCVGCGACKVSSPENITIKFLDSGFYEARQLNSEEKISEEQLDKVCPFSDISDNETKISESLFDPQFHKFDERVGYYHSIYAGHINDPVEREKSSSGGMTSWICEKLLLDNKVDAVVHVASGEGMFSYKVSRTISELRDKASKKSRYYPVTYEKILTELKESNERIVFVGIPCFIKSIRLLQASGVLNNIEFCISLLCGHMKSSGFGESLAWQLGVPPKNLLSVDFRVKNKGYLASNYFFQAENDDKEVFEANNSSLLGANWGLGLFRHKSCDFCDDIAGELADVTLGDAWLPKYTSDYLGTNILVVRNDIINTIFNEYASELTLEAVDVDTFYETQAGNYRNRRGGILARVKGKKVWFPTKRLDICTKYAGTNQQEKIYRFRTLLSQVSHKNFLIAKKYNSFFIFKLLMLPSLIKYSYLLGGCKSILRLMKLLFINRVKVVKKATK
ncbi:Coenzyme F420 hydrogenase/dehydrogenase, beta subunit C-terminal domain [Vibrio natriegens]|uniref:Coenzyme F420 hydrogenase/dehydrogenase, beta subunit C-terminal domain n=1 Tax=Vibrio natriegens TaxID=691 RepID=UPI003556E757